MCGICGMVGKSDKVLLQAMCDVLRHRGPDGEGQYVDEHAAIGARRLAIIDLATGDQPIGNEDGSLWIVFNGEIYNFPELRDTLQKKGHRFRTQSDTEVIVHAYEEYGTDCLRHFNGMFAFAIWDKGKQDLFLARDRVGEKPLYYWEKDHYLVFASEIKAILQDPAFERRIDLATLYNYLGRLYIPGEKSIFMGIRRLPPAHFMHYRDGVIRLERYWQIDFSHKLRRSEQEYCDEIYERLKEAVRKRLVSDVPLGTFLSGGVDSSSVVGLMAELSSQPVKTFSLGFAEELNTPYAFNELGYARRVADFFGTEHHEFIIQAEDLFRELPHIAWHFDEPYAGSLPQYFLSRLTREYVTVALAGVGGDELFGSYGRSEMMARRLGKWTMRYLKWSPVIQTGIASLLNLYPRIGFWNQACDKAKGVIWRAENVGQVYANGPLTIFSEEAKTELCSSKIFGHIPEKERLDAQFQRLYQECNAHEFMDQMFYLDFKTQLVDEFLHYNDILSMAHSLEMRVPYLDYEFVEYVMRIPAAQRSKPGEVKYLLKKALTRLLPEDILNRPKGGFSLPYGRWIDRELKPAVQAYLAPARLTKQGYFNPGYVSKLLREHYGGIRDHTYQIWVLFMFELWHAIYIEDRAMCLGTIRNL